MDPRMTEFHAALAENPNENTGHAVYADWLEEQGMPGIASVVRSPEVPGFRMQAYQEWGLPMTPGRFRATVGYHAGQPHSVYIDHRSTVQPNMMFRYRLAGLTRDQVHSMLGRIKSEGVSLYPVAEVELGHAGPDKMTRLQALHARYRRSTPAGRLTAAVRRYSHLPGEPGYQDPHEAAFHKAIADNPAERTHWAAYADWLDDRGERPGFAALLRAMADHAPGLGVHADHGVSMSGVGTQTSESVNNLANTNYIGNSHARVTYYKNALHGPKDFFRFSGVFPKNVAAALIRGFHAGGERIVGASPEAARYVEQMRPKAEEPAQLSRAVRRYAAYRAPKGGAVAFGTYYQGGKLMPDLEKFDPVKMSALKATWREKAKKVKAVSGGSTNREDYSGGNGTGGMVVSYAQATPVTWHDKDGVLHTGEVTGAGDSGGTVTVTENGPSGKPGGKKRTLDLFDKYTSPAFSQPGDKVSQFARVASMVARYAAGPDRDLVNLFRQARENPYDETLHGAIADRIEETDPSSPFPELIRRQFGLGQHTEPRDNLYHDPFYNSWDTTFPYTARLGRHGPFDLYLGHEGGPQQNQRWVVHAVAAVNRNPAHDDSGYTFEFPHEEAHLIPQMFPGAAEHIDPTHPHPWGDIQREHEAQEFGERMDTEERDRE